MATTSHVLSDRFAAELVRRGLPSDYARRAALELSDHHHDLVVELCDAGLDEVAAGAEAARRLGDSRTLAKNTVREYQRRFWCGRWPLITFLLGPLPLLFLVWVASALLSLCIAWSLEKVGVVGPGEPDGIISTGERVGVYGLQTWYLFVMPALVMFVLARLANRAALKWTWVGIAACVLALSLVSFKCGIPSPPPKMLEADGTTLPADRYLCVVEIPDSWSVVWSWIGVQHAQCLLPVIIAVMVLLRSRQLAIHSERLILDEC